MMTILRMKLQTPKLTNFLINFDFNFDQTGEIDYFNNAI